MKHLTSARTLQRLAALVLVFAMLLPASGCMSLYLFSEEIDPDGTLFSAAEEEQTYPIEIPAPTEAPKPTAAPAATAEPAPYESIIQNDTGIKFSEMVYTRPDTDAIYDAVEALEDAYEAGEEDVAALLKRYDAMIALYDAASDEMSLAYVLYSMDVTDDHYKDEYDDLVVALTDLDVLMTDISIKLFDDPRTADAMLAAYGEDFIDCVRSGRELNSPEIQKYIEKEQKLTGEYDELRTTFVYKERGKTYTMEDIAAIAETDYEEYARLYNAYYAAFNKKAGAIFLELVELRDAIAKTLGFRNYTEYQYRCYNRDYTPAEARQLHNAVKNFIVPLYFNGILSFYMNNGYEQVEAIRVEEEPFFDMLQEELASVSPEALEAFEYMRRNELYTTEQSDTKMEAGYTTYLGAYESPFLFMEFTDDTGSAATVMHELGHFTRFCIEPADSWSIVDPLDVLEIDSQGLELMLVHEYDDFYGEAGEMAAKEHLLNGLYALITGCMEDEFQQKVYANPDMTLEEMNEYYAELASAYGMTDLYGFSGTEWAIIPHTFQSPLYYISYAVSVVPSLELWAMAEEDENRAAATYQSLLHRPTFTVLREVLAENGLSDPLAGATVKHLAEVLSETLIG